MANRFWVGGTGTWDSTDTTHWAATSGGAGGASAPVAGDAVIFDANFGTGTMTADSSISGIAFLSMTCTALTGGNTLNFNTNNPNMSFTSFVSGSGTGTRTINLGSGTWTITGAAGGSIWDFTTITNLTPTFSNASLVFSGASSAVRNLVDGGVSGGYGPLTIAANSSKGPFRIQNGGTFASITVADGTTLILPAATTTITGALTITGTSSNQSGLITVTPNATVATVSVGAASTIEWAGILGITRSGAGTLDASNSFDMGRNSSFTSLTAPSGGGGGGQRVISG